MTKNILTDWPRQDKTLSCFESADYNLSVFLCAIRQAQFSPTAQHLFNLRHIA